MTPRHKLHETMAGNREANLGNFTECFEIPDEYFYTRAIGLEVFMCAITVFTSAATILENAVILLSIRRNASLHTPSNMLLVNLALSDIAFGLLVQPLFIAGVIARIEQRGRAFCVVSVSTNALGNCLCCVSLLTLTAINSERYLALRLHLRYQEVVTVKRILLLVISMWTFGALVGLLWLLHVKVCRIFSLIVIFSCVLLVSYASSNVYRIVRYHQRKIHATVDHHDAKTKAQELAKFKRATTSMLLVYILLLVCYLPYFCSLVSILSSDQSTPRQTSIRDLATILISVNSSLNPVVYCWRLREIRRAVQNTLRALCSTNSVEWQGNWGSEVFRWKTFCLWSPRNFTVRPHIKIPQKYFTPVRGQTTSLMIKMIKRGCFWLFSLADFSWHTCPSARLIPFVKFGISSRTV